MSSTKQNQNLSYWICINNANLCFGIANEGPIGCLLVYLAGWLLRAWFSCKYWHPNFYIPLDTGAMKLNGCSKRSKSVRFRCTSVFPNVIIMFCQPVLHQMLDVVLKHPAGMREGWWVVGKSNDLTFPPQVLTTCKPLVHCIIVLFISLRIDPFWRATKLWLRCWHLFRTGFDCLRFWK